MRCFGGFSVAKPPKNPQKIILSRIHAKYLVRDR
jgi:hypothetical protein